MQSAGPSSSSSSAGGKPDRLYVGNLAPTVDEYTLIQVFQKYGKITKLDFMFHKAGVLKGKPRGYAFIEFSNKDDALKAMVKLHDRLLRGRKLVVTYANSAPPSDLPPPTKGRRTEAPKTTTLSLLKSSRKPQSAAAQIAAMEAKLAAMAKRKPADEDYVPGQGRYDASGSASPAIEDELGREEAENAADDLEKEMLEELGDIRDEERAEAVAVHESSAAGTPEPVSSPTLAAPLPPRPVGPPTAVIPSNNDRTKAREEAFQRGLAGLPKKPVF